MKSQYWMWEQEPDGEPVVCDSSRRPIAALNGCDADKALVRASLIAAAPALYETLNAVADVLREMAKEEKGRPAGLAAQDLMPVVENTLAGANFMGPVTPDKLVGP